MSDIAGIFASEVPALDRHVQIGVASGKVVQVSFPERPDEEAATDHDVLDRLVAYLGGATEDDFEDVPVALTLPTDQRSVLETLQSVPYGRSVRVEQLARMTPGLPDDDDGSDRTVRAALDANPAPILVPDHRVRDPAGRTPPDVEEYLRSMEGLDP